MTARRASVRVMRWLAMMGVLIFGSACAVDLCDRATDLNQTFQHRHADCFDDGTLPAPRMDDAQCKASLEACTQADEAVVQAYFDCLEKLPACTRPELAAFNEKLLACATPMSTLSAGCFRAP